MISKKDILFKNYIFFIFISFFIFFYLWWPLRTDVGLIPLFISRFCYAKALMIEKLFLFLDAPAGKFLYLFLSPFLYFIVSFILLKNYKRKAFYVIFSPILVYISQPYYVSIAALSLLVPLYLSRLKDEKSQIISSFVIGYIFQENPVAASLLTFISINNKNTKNKVFISLIPLLFIFSNSVSIKFNLSFLSIYLNFLNSKILSLYVLFLLIFLLYRKKYSYSLLLLSSFLFSDYSFSMFPIIAAHYPLLGLEDRYVYYYILLTVSSIFFMKPNLDYEIARLKAVKTAQLTQEAVYPTSFLYEAHYFLRNKNLFYPKEKEFLEPKVRSIAFLNALMFYKKEGDLSKARELAEVLNVDTLELFKSPYFIEKKIKDRKEAEEWIDYLFPAQKLTFLISLDPIDMTIFSYKFNFNEISLIKATNLIKLDDNSTLQAADLKIDLRDFKYCIKSDCKGIKEFILYDKGKLQIYSSKKEGSICEIIKDTSSCLIFPENEKNYFLTILHARSMMISPFSPIITIYNSTATRNFLKAYKKFKERK